MLAFHEAFADLVALFQRFSYRSLIIDELHEFGGRVELSNWLVSLAQQFGLATGTGKALRSAIGQVDPRALETEFEPHDRGAILVSAIFGGFLRVVNRRTNELFRIASGGSGIKSPGRLPTDLVARLASEIADVADRVLRMCFRAFDYLPPVDVTFGDFLRALVTADFELSPDDRDELRFSMIEEFRLRGIYPEGVVSLAEKSLISLSADYLPKLEGLEQQTFHLLALAASALDWSARLRIQQKQRLKARTSRRSALPGFEDALREYQRFVLEPERPEREQSEIARGLNKYARENAEARASIRRTKISTSPDFIRCFASGATSGWSWSSSPSLCKQGIFRSKAAGGHGRCAEVSPLCSAPTMSRAMPSANPFSQKS